MWSMRKVKARNMTALIVKILVILLWAWVFFRWFEWRSLYAPTRGLESTPEDIGLAYEETRFMSEDGAALHGWWIPAEDARGTVLFCHGNAGNMGDRLGTIKILNGMGVHVFIFDYRGYGRSRGLPTEKATYRDARAAYEVVRARYENAEQPPIVIMGRSLGGAVAVQLAKDRPARGLILESCFTSTADMARELYPWFPGRLCSFRYDSASKMSDVRMPVLIAHSKADELIPFHMGRTLFERTREPKQFFELQDSHNAAPWESTPRYAERLEAFLREVGL